MNSKNTKAIFISIKNTVLCLLMYIATFSFGQTMYSGIVVDVKTKQPLAFTSVYYMQHAIGVVSDERGKFTLPRVLNDTLVVDHLGYATFSIHSAKLPDSIQLLEKTYLLSSIEVHGRKSIYTPHTISYELYNSKTPDWGLGCAGKFGIKIPLDSVHHLIAGIEISLVSMPNDSVKMRNTIHYRSEKDSTNKDALYPISTIIHWIYKKQLPCKFVIHFDEPIALPENGWIWLNVEALDENLKYSVAKETFTLSDLPHCASFSVGMTYQKEIPTQYFSNISCLNKKLNPNHIIEALAAEQGLKMNSIDMKVVWYLSK